MPVQRRSAHELYLRALTDPNPEGFDLDFATIVDCLWPSRGQAIVSPDDRPAVRGWVDELVAAGILVRDHTKDRTKGDFFVLHPRYAAKLDTALNEARALPDPPPASQFSPFQKSLLIAWVVAIVGLLYLFYCTFMPRELPAQIIGGIGLVTAILGLGGWHVKAAGSFWDALWSRPTIFWLGAATLLLVGLLTVGYASPCRVRVIPGATIYVDGNFYKHVTLVPGQSFRERWENLYLSWGDHEIAVSKPWHVDYAARTPKSARHVNAPRLWGHPADTRLVAYVEFHLSDSFASFQGPSLEEERRRKMQEDIEYAESRLKELFRQLVEGEKLDDPSSDCSLTLTHDRVPSMNVVGNLELDRFSQHYFLDISLQDQEGHVIKSLQSLQFDPSPEISNAVLLVTGLKARIQREIGIEVTLDVENGCTTEEGQNYSAYKKADKGLDKLVQVNDQLANAATPPDVKKQLLTQGIEPSQAAVSDVGLLIEESADPKAQSKLVTSKTARALLDVLDARIDASLQLKAWQLARAYATQVVEIGEKAIKRGDRIVARTALDLLKTTNSKLGQADDAGLAKELSEMESTLREKFQQGFASKG